MNQNKNQLKQPLMAQYHKTPELSVSSVFKLRPEELELFFLREHQKMPDNEGERRECLIILEKVDWQQGLLKSLATDAETGIIGDVKDIKRRQKFFGKNERSLPQVRSFWAVLWDQFDEFYIILLLIFATASLLLSIFGGEKGKWIESVSVYFAVLFAATIQTLCDWGKEKQFLRLRKEIMNEKVTVLRGQYGTSQTVYVADLVVGDIVDLDQGDRVPADCICIEEMDMKVDQKQFYQHVDDSEMTVKQCSYNDVEKDKNENPDPILLQDSIVMTGTCKAVVLAVGEHTLKEKEIKNDLKNDQYALQVEKNLTPFQTKLEILAGIIGAYAYTLCIVALVLFGIVWLIFVMASDYRLVDSTSINRAIDLASTAIALLIVCIPEGMPLVISMAMAFSVDKLKEEHLLIKNLDALETSGQLSNIITGKTATLTTGDMEVAKINIDNTTYAAENFNCNIEVQNFLWDCIIMNCDAHMQMKGIEYQPIGSPVEVGLLKLLLANNVNVQDKLIERENSQELMLWIPFSSDRKRMTVAYTLKEDPETVRLVVKGAPEFITKMCSSYMNDFKQATPFNGQGSDGAAYLEKVENELILADENDEDAEMHSGFKPLTIAYRDFNKADFEGMKNANFNFENEDSRAIVESDLTLVSSLSLQDPLRDDIDHAIEQLHNSKTNVRIISGDHKMNVMCTAKRLGFTDDLYDDTICMPADDLLAQLEDLMIEVEDTEEGRGKTFTFRNKESKSRFKKMKNNVVLVYRATPKLKHMFVCAFRQSNSTIGVTGEGLSDSRALSEANVGFTMGEDGCAAAKDHADIILMNDNFHTVITAIRWGRNIQDNVRKFIQFQMTVNFSCMCFVLSSSLILGHSPFNIVQLLWINLVMDVLAAIAFATENPHPTEIRGDRIKPTDKLITKPMMRSILSQGIYQLVVMIIMLYGGPAMFDISYNLFTTEMKYDNVPSYRMMHQTLMFQVFIMMNLFNMINCRILDQMPEVTDIESSTVAEQDEEAKPSQREFNIFQRPFQNFWFWIVFFGELNVQFFMVGYPALGYLFTTTPITFGMHMTAICFGIGSWILAAIMKTTGIKLLNIMPEFGEDAEALIKANAVKNAKFQKSSEENDEDETRKGDESDE